MYEQKANCWICWQSGIFKFQCYFLCINKQSWCILLNLLTYCYARTIYIRYLMHIIYIANNLYWNCWTCLIAWLPIVIVNNLCPHYLYCLFAEPAHAYILYCSNNLYSVFSVWSVHANREIINQSLIIMRKILPLVLQSHFANFVEFKSK